MQDMEIETKKKLSYRNMMIRSFISIIAIGVAIFALAGRLDYWQGWLFFLSLLVLMAAFGVFFAKRQDLMQERLRPGPGVKWWDKIFFTIYVPLSFLVSLFAALDAGRSMFVHLGNGCPMQMHRHENIIQRVLSLHGRLWICFIADDHHIPLYALGNYIRSAGLDKTVVVTDGQAASGMGPGVG